MHGPLNAKKTSCKNKDLKKVDLIFTVQILL
jgi:hypothetical protein